MLGAELDHAITAQFFFIVTMLISLNSILTLLLKFELFAL